jgi:hypothetical protein
MVTDISLDGAGYFLPAAIITIVAVVVIGILMFRQRAKKRQSLRGDTAASRHPARNRLDYQPEEKPIPVFRPMAAPAHRTRASALSKPEDIDLTRTRRDITESLAALAGKYSLQTFTIATADGLVLGSSGGDTAEADAATCSELFKNHPLTGTPGVVLFGLTHKGSALVGIVRSPSPLPAEIVSQIDSDTKLILNRWI